MNNVSPLTDETWTTTALDELSSSGDVLLAEADRPVEFVVDGLVEDGDLVLLSGREKEALKTWLALDLAVARISGGRWLGRSVSKCTGRVLFVSAETSPRNIGRRLRALCVGRGLDAAKVARSLIVVREPISLVTRERLDRASEEIDSRLHTKWAAERDADSRVRLLDTAKVEASAAADRLGRNVRALREIYGAPPSTFGLIVFDTLRAALEGDENSSDDAREAMQAARDLARSAACPVMVVHHNNKNGDASDTRSARGSVEITAAPDVIFSADTTTEPATLRVRMRNHEAPAAFGYALEIDAEQNAARLVLREASKAPARDVSVDDVFALFQRRPGEGLTLSSVRSLVSEARGGKPGSKANSKRVETALLSLLSKGAISTCDIETANGRTFGGYMLGSVGGRVKATRPEPAVDAFAQMGAQ